jgi:hypothetical protein
MRVECHERRKEDEVLRASRSMLRKARAITEKGEDN